MLIASFYRLKGCPLCINLLLFISPTDPPPLIHFRKAIRNCWLKGWRWLMPCSFEKSVNLLEDQLTEEVCYYRYSSFQKRISHIQASNPASFMLWNPIKAWRSFQLCCSSEVSSPACSFNPSFIPPLSILSPSVHD